YIFNFSPPLFLTYHYFAFIKKQQMINFQSRNKILLDVPLKVKTIESSKGFLSLTICNPLSKGEQIDKIFICFYIFLFPKDRKSTRLNSSHVSISYAVFCLKKKKN